MKRPYIKKQNVSKHDNGSICLVVAKNHGEEKSLPQPQPV